jgi:hypothetical protein
MTKIFEFNSVTFSPGTPGIPANVNPPYTNLGRYVLSGPTQPVGKEEKCNQTGKYDFTGPPGTAAGLYYALVFQLLNWKYFVQKVDEWVEVNPTHKEYYERTVATKQALEGTIKQGLISAAQAVADFELISHDLRKYKEIMNFFASNDEHSLKAMFIDQVDIHTDLPGQPIAMRSIAPRWPTIIADFIRLDEKDVDIKDISKKFNVSQAEAVILATKNKLYNQWKVMFREAVVQRYQLLKGLVEARRKSIDEYRNWLKPYIARFKMTKLGHEALTETGKLGMITRSFIDITGMATFTNGIRIWAWKFLKAQEHRKVAAEIREEPSPKAMFVISPYDNWIREHYVLDNKDGLVGLYPWLGELRYYCDKCKKFYKPTEVNKEFCPTCESILEEKTEADRIVLKEILPKWATVWGGASPELYYVFIDIQIERIGIRHPAGEIENIVFDMYNWIISQNVLLLKMLELKCREIELEKYVDTILGLKTQEKDIEQIVKEEYPKLFNVKEAKYTGSQKFLKEFRGMGKEFRKFSKGFKLPKQATFEFMRPGPYENHMTERLTKHYLAIGGIMYANIANFIKQKMGIE